MPSPVRARATSDVFMTVVSTKALAQGNAANAVTGVRSGSSGFPLNLSHQEVILGLNSELNIETTVSGNSSVIAGSGAMICRDKSTEMLSRRAFSQNRNVENINPSAVGAQFHQSSPIHYY